ncbi:MAG: hypothetical protein H6719_12895 [Sandaracinaceae bacterium]|nr:hypothetical protein [Sandaracinaceae bacterium]
MTSPTRLTALSLSLLLIACGGDADEPDTSADTSGGEAVVVAPEVATGPVRSYVAEDAAVTMRLDMTRVRASAVSADIASLVRAYPAWQQLLGSSGIDPVRDFDRVLVTSATTATDSGTMLIVHNLTNERVREAVLAMAVDRGARPEWRQEDGFDVVDWPAETDPPRVVVLTGAHELVVTTTAELPGILAIAHDHRLRRQADEVVEPALALEDGVIAMVHATQVSERMAARIEHPPQGFDLELRDAPGDGEEDRMTIAIRGGYADAAAAEAARAWAVQQRDFYAGQMLVRAVGLDRALRDAQITAQDSDLVIDASFTEEEVQRVLGLLAFAQIGGS